MIELPSAQQQYLDRLALTNPQLADSLRPRPPDPPHMDSCIHEAAHALAMHAFGRPIEYAEVDSGGGRVQPVPDSRTEFFHHLIMVMAGDMATSNQPPLSRAEWTDVLAGTREEYVQSDERVIALFARHFAGPDSSIDEQLAVIGAAWDAAADMFAEPGFWPAVVAVAETLRVNHHLTGAQVHELAEREIAFGALQHKENYRWKK